MEKFELKLLCHSSKENELKALSSSVVSRKPKHAKLLPGLQRVEKGSQQVDSTGSPMIMDEIEKAEIPPPETRSDGDDEHSELEENLSLVFQALSKGQEHQRKHLAKVVPTGTTSSTCSPSAGHMSSTKSCNDTDDRWAGPIVGTTG